MIYDGRFEDLDGDTLSYTFDSSDDNIATIEDRGNGIVRFTRVSSGTVTFTVTAVDGNGGTISDVFTVTIN